MLIDLILLGKFLPDLLPACNELMKRFGKFSILCLHKFLFGGNKVHGFLPPKAELVMDLFCLQIEGR